jgi:hypothetical protein
MSALPPIADVLQKTAVGCLAPEAVMRRLRLEMKDKPKSIQKLRGCNTNLGLTNRAEVALLA